MTISKIPTKDYLTTLGDSFEFIEIDNYIISVMPSNGEFQYFSYVNGLYMRKGGVHIQYISSEISRLARDKLIKKYNTIKPQDIKNHIKLVCIFKNFPQIEVDSQTKESLENSESAIRKYLQLDFTNIVNKILKNKAIIDPIIDMFKAKEMVKLKQQMKSIKKKKIQSEKYFRATKKNKYLVLTEGLSAFGAASSGLGREEYSYYALKGKLLNVLKNSSQKVLGNTEIQDIIRIIAEDKPEIILTGTDQDLDGFHIAALVMTFIKKYFPEYTDNMKFGRFKTPLIVYYDSKGKITETYYDMESHNKSNVKHKGQMKYLKGLGSLEDGWIDQIIELDGLENMIEIFDFSKSESLEPWMNAEDIQFRKSKIKDNEFSILML